MDEPTSMLLLGVWRWPRRPCPPLMQCLCNIARKKTESAFECPVQRGCIINEITLADGSHLGTPPPPTTTEICSWLTCTHILYFSSLVTCASDCLSLLFLVLFTLGTSLNLSFSLDPLLCARLFFIKRFDLGSQAFRPKLQPHSRPTSTSSPFTCPTLFPSFHSSTHTERFVHTSSKAPLFQADYRWLAFYVETPAVEKDKDGCLRLKWCRPLLLLTGFPKFRAHTQKIQLSSLSAKMKHQIMHTLK